MKRTICKSGIIGWEDTLHNTYDNSFEQFEMYCNLFNIHIRLGFESTTEAWDANPIIQGSVIPSDLCISSK